jgi:Fibronectin type III domain
MLRSHGRMRPVLVAVLMAVPFAGVGATLTARAAGADPAAPSAPRSPIAVPSGSTGARVSWNAPASDGGSAITGYTVIPYTGYRFQAQQPPQIFNEAATTETLVGLKKATAWRFKVVATNAIGSGPGSAQTAAIVIGTPAQPARPTVKKVAKGTLQVSFHPPKNNGAPITRYTVGCTQVTNSLRNTTATGHASPILVSGQGLMALVAGKSYTCVVRAANSRGPSVASPRSAKVKM